MKLDFCLFMLCVIGVKTSLPKSPVCTAPSSIIARLLHSWECVSRESTSFLALPRVQSSSAVLGSRKAWWEIPVSWLTAGAQNRGVLSVLTMTVSNEHTFSSPALTSVRATDEDRAVLLCVIIATRLENRGGPGSTYFEARVAPWAEGPCLYLPASAPQIVGQLVEGYCGLCSASLPGSGCACCNRRQSLSFLSLEGICFTTGMRSCVSNRSRVS